MCTPAARKWDAILVGHPLPAADAHVRVLQAVLKHMMPAGNILVATVDTGLQGLLPSDTVLLGTGASYHLGWSSLGPLGGIYTQV